MKVSYAVGEALSIATNAHYGQTRNDGITPYVVHPIRVGGLLKYYYPDSPLLEIAGYLHDVVEDTDWNISNVGYVFGDDVARLVEDVTKYPDKPWPLPTWPDSVRLKAADTYDNVMDFNGNFGQFASGNRKIHQWWKIYQQSWEIIGDEPLVLLLKTRLDVLDQLVIDSRATEVPI